MKAVADTLGIARSNLADRVKRGGSRPRSPYRKVGDAELLVELRRFLDLRPTYGYRRLTALLNRERRPAGKPVVNAKRVLRVLRAHGLTLQAHTARRPGRTHDGVVVALRSNIRWCSDHLEIGCRDGGVVRPPTRRCGRTAAGPGSGTGFVGCAGLRPRPKLFASSERLAA